MREYFHETQQQVLYTPAKTVVLCAGRGWGKGPIHAAINLRNMQRMPGSITGFVAANCKRALTNTIPSMLIHWQKWGGVISVMFIGLSVENRPNHGDGVNQSFSRTTGKM